MRLKPIDDLDVFVSPLTHRIYAGFADARTGQYRTKKDITHIALSCVAKHLDTNGEYTVLDTPKGKLMWIKKDDTP